MRDIVRHILRHRSIRVAIAWLLGFVVPVVPGRITFVTRTNVPFAGNLRIVADRLARDGHPDVAVYRDAPLAAETASALRGAGMTVLAGFDLAVLRRILSSETVVLSHSARDAYLSRRRRGQRVINLWHGVALKRIESLMRAELSPGARARRRLIRRNARIYDAMIASGSVDRLVITAAFGVPFDKVQPIGLPRFDYLFPDEPLPPDLAAEEARLLELLDGRRLVVYAPTFREKQRSALNYLDERAQEAIRAFCRRNGLVFGLRTHPYELKLQQASGIADGRDIIDLGAAAFQEPNLVLRHCSALIVDYSSIWVDFLLKDRTIVGFVPDYDSYSTQERGFIYEQEDVFPGPMMRDLGSVLACLERAAVAGFPPLDSERHGFSAHLLMPPATERRHVAARCAEVLFGGASAPASAPHRPRAAEPEILLLAPGEAARSG